MKDNKESVLILGGYGRAGRSVARILANHYPFEIITAGRSIDKANDHAEELQNMFPDRPIKAMEVDIGNREKLINAVNEVHLVIVAVPLDSQKNLLLIEAVLNSRQAHYIDLCPGSEKLQAFENMKKTIETGRHLFILDAGFEPGLPGFMVRWVLSETEQPEEVVVEGLYRDPEIPSGGVEDILGRNEPAFIFKKGQLKKVSAFNVKTVHFPYGFGKAASVPIWMPELQSIPKEYNIRKLVYYHAGINWLANIILYSWKTILNKILPVKTGVKLFKWAIGNFTKQPFGGVIQVTAKGQHTGNKYIISHHELYEATAIPVVATAHLVFMNTSGQSGSFFMGEWVPKRPFLDIVKSLGMTITVEENSSG